MVGINQLTSLFQELVCLLLDNKTRHPLSLLGIPPDYKKKIKGLLLWFHCEGVTTNCDSRQLLALTRLTPECCWHQVTLLLLAVVVGGMFTQPCFFLSCAVLLHLTIINLYCWIYELLNKYCLCLYYSCLLTKCGCIATVWRTYGAQLVKWKVLLQITLSCCEQNIAFCWSGWSTKHLFKNVSIAVPHRNPMKAM